MNRVGDFVHRRGKLFEEEVEEDLVLHTHQFLLDYKSAAAEAEEMAETVEETFETEVRRKVTRTSFKIEEVSRLNVDKEW